MENLIFEKPSLAPFPQRIGWAFFTVAFWLIWIYLWMPLITLIAWGLGLHAYTGFFDASGSYQMRAMGHIAILYTSVVCLMGGSLLLWARIEFLRFHDVNRRTIPVAVNVDELAKYAALPEQTLQDWMVARRVVVHHDDAGQVIIRKSDKSIG